MYEARRSPRPITEAACRAHGRRKFFVLADLRQGPLRGHSGATQEPLRGHWRIEAVRRIDEIFAGEREIDGAGPECRA